MTSQSLDEWIKDFPELQPKPVSEAIDWLLAHASDARWDIVAKYMNIMYIAGLRKQISEDGFRL